MEVSCPSSPFSSSSRLTENSGPCTAEGSSPPDSANTVCAWTPPLSLLIPVGLPPFTLGPNCWCYLDLLWIHCPYALLSLPYCYKCAAWEHLCPAAPASLLSPELNIHAFEIISASRVLIYLLQLPSPSPPSQAGFSPYDCCFFSGFLMFLGAKLTRLWPLLYLTSVSHSPACLRPALPMCLTHYCHASGPSMSLLWTPRRIFQMSLFQITFFSFPRFCWINFLDQGSTGKHFHESPM